MNEAACRVRDLMWFHLSIFKYGNLSYHLAEERGGTIDMEIWRYLKRYPKLCFAVILNGVCPPGSHWSDTMLQWKLM